MPEFTREFCLSVATAARVTSGAPVFFGRLQGLGNTDRPSFGSGLEMLWRELSGSSEAPELRAAVVGDLAGFRAQAEAASAPLNLPVVASVDVLVALFDESVSEAERLRRITDLAQRIAEAMDGLNAAAPEGYESWVAYEAASQAQLAASTPDEVSTESVQELRNESGAQGLAYWSAMRAQPRPSTT
ncbi:hypothetical protein FB565_002668 [Actinoplanes lutulentus]|uniref:Uncharacterized protein n=1 Tax=Actinoplanes lutulentus TaxID=1287878 RepID=A0A327Z005_9ACTN|nr:hypothetical protein [Actinoplanes lutulentus]MBB2942955.1 hypothetical protein [Actinoplanes lutulentus]RAK26779.1 hypothetical protein B0I29_126170 [Actinoplanes lutulentus]